MNVIFSGLLGPMLAKILITAALIVGVHTAVNHAPKAWQAWKDTRDDAAGRALHGEPKDHRGPKWAAAGSRERVPGYSSTEGKILIWSARGYVLIGSETDVMYRRPADVLGWGLNRTKYVKDVAKPKTMFGGRTFPSRGAAQRFLKSKITKHGRIPLVSANRKGQIGGRWYNTTNALGR